MTRVIHTGDTHLGYRQYHSPERRADFLTAFRAVAEDALAGDVDAVVHAGDLFHDRRPDLGDVYGAIDVLRDLRDGGVPFLAVVGNHERTADHQWLDLFEALGLADRLGPEPTVINDVAFYGLDFVPRARRPDLTYDFAPHDSTHAALVSHGLFTPFNSDWDLSMVLEAAPVDFDVVLLGDDHHPDTAQVNDTWVTYCGSTERVSAAEREDRGYNIVEFEPDQDVAIRRRGIETRNFVILDLELGPGEGTSRITERLGQEPLEDAVVVVGIDGEGAAVAPAEIESFARERGALVARVNDRREFETAEAGTVEFADPEVAVAERLHEMAPSGAALRIDELVRTEDIPDSTLRGRVKTAVEELLEEDPNAFEPGTGEPPTPKPAEPLDQPDTGREDTAEPPNRPDDATTGVTVEDVAADLAGTSASEAPSDEPAERVATDASDEEPPSPSSDEEEDPTSEPTDAGEDTGRPTTMEDFL